MEKDTFKPKKVFDLDNIRREIDKLLYDENYAVVEIVDEGESEIYINRNADSAFINLDNFPEYCPFCELELIDGYCVNCEIKFIHSKIGEK